MVMFNSKYMANKNKGYADKVVKLAEGYAVMTLDEYYGEYRPKTYPKFGEIAHRQGKKNVVR